MFQSQLSKTENAGLKIITATAVGTEIDYELGVEPEPNERHRSYMRQSGSYSGSDARWTLTPRNADSRLKESPTLEYSKHWPKK